MSILLNSKQTSSSMANPTGPGFSKGWHLSWYTMVNNTPPSDGLHFMATSSSLHQTPFQTFLSGLSEPAAFFPNTSWMESSRPWHQQRQLVVTLISTRSKRPKPKPGNVLDLDSHHCPLEVLDPTMRYRSILVCSNTQAVSSPSHGSPRTHSKDCQETPRLGN